MALGDPYATLSEYRAFEEIDADDTSKDVRLELALRSATSAIDQYCNRTFNKAETATARIFMPMAKDIIIVDDFYDTSDVMVKIGRVGGSFGTAYDPAAYRLDPPNGVKDGAIGWPVERIVLHRSHSWNVCLSDEVEVTAKWGWAAVPPEVKQATLLMASRYYKLGDAPLGVVGLKRFSSSRPGNDSIADLLCEYIKEPYLG